MPRITVVGSANTDIVARCERLPRPGETVTDAMLERIPGGKGANQAVAAARMGARVRFVGRIGADDLVLRSLGEHTFNRYIEIKRQEWEDYRVQVTPWELERYLPVL